MSDLGNAVNEARAVAVTVPTHHNEFYLDDKHIKIQAGDTIYRVHTHFFLKESDKARAVVKKAEMAEGQQLFLDGVASQDLEAFLKVLYCRIFESSPLSSKTEWVSVLRLSHAWNFASMHAFAVRQLDNLTTPIDRIALGKQYGIDHWLSPAYQAVCERDLSLTDEEGMRLGLMDVLKIARARQIIRSSTLLMTPATRSVALDAWFGTIDPEESKSCTSTTFYRTAGQLTKGDQPMASQVINQSPNTAAQTIQTPSFVLPPPGETVPVPAGHAMTAPPLSQGRKHVEQLLEPSPLVTHAPISDAMRANLLKTATEIEELSKRLSKAQQALDTHMANQRLVSPQSSVNVLSKPTPTPPVIARFCNPLPARVHPTQQAVSDLKSALNGARARLVGIILPGATAHARSYCVPPAMCAALVAALSKVDSAIATRANVAAKTVCAADMRARVDETFGRPQSHHPSATAAPAVDDANSQPTPLPPVLSSQEGTIAETRVVRAQQELAQLLARLASAASSS